MTNILRDPRAFTAVLVPIPGLGQKQPPPQRTRRPVGRSVDRYQHLTIRGLPQRPAVLMRHPRRHASVLRQAGVIHHPPLRTDLRGHPDRQPPPDRSVTPRRIGNELLQPLLIPVRQPGRHRLDRLAPPLQQQPANVLLALRALITPRQRPVHLLRERDQPRALTLKIPRRDPELPHPHRRHTEQVPCTRKNSCTQLTKSY